MLWSWKSFLYFFPNAYVVLIMCFRPMKQKAFKGPKDFFLSLLVHRETSQNAGLFTVCWSMQGWPQEEKQCWTDYICHCNSFVKPLGWLLLFTCLRSLDHQFYYSKGFSIKSHWHSIFGYFHIINFLPAFYSFLSSCDVFRLLIFCKNLKEL